MFDKIGYVIVFARDMDRSLVFYRDVLGLPVKFASPEWTEFDLKGTALALHPLSPEMGITPGASGISIDFLTEDIEATFTALQRKGAKFDGPIRDEDFGRFASLRDPDGYRIGIGQMKGYA